jgi:macrolide transport system ATP-binding/permease protein
MISLQKISFDYISARSEWRALHELNLDIRRGEYVAIIGTSGSGKTTLMNVLGLLAQPTSGQYMLDESSTETLTADDQARLRNRKIGYIFQNFFLLPRLSVLDNILLPAQYIEEGAGLNWEQRAHELLVQFGLGDKAQQLPNRLSGGQKQRVAICRALLLDPEIILADEPTGALDSTNSKLVLDILTSLVAQGKTVIIITHDAAVAARAQRIIRLQDGRIVDDTTQKNPASSMDVSPADAKPPAPLADSPYVTPRGRGWKMAKSTVTAFRHSLASLSANPTRAALTLFGLAVGVASIIIMLTLTEEARQIFRSYFDTQGGRTGFVSVDWRTAERLGSPRWPGVHRDMELPAMNTFFAQHGRVAARTEENDCTFVSRYATSTGMVRGTESVSEFAEDGLKVDQGRFFSPQETEARNPARVALLGSAASKVLFPQTTGQADGASKANAALVRDLTGEIVTIRGCSIKATLTIVGTLQEQDAMFDRGINGAIWMPTPTMRASGLQPYSRNLITVPSEGIDPTWFTESVKNYIRMRTGDKYPLRTFVAADHVARIETMLSILGGLTVVIGAMCTTIGGIGVMNIMLVNIAERLREIGIRKAVGARNKRIYNQFLLESALLCSLSGVIGLGFGVIICNGAIYATAQFAPKYVQEAFVWNTPAAVIALVSSIAVGIGFGVLPARRASQIDVVEALQRE